MRGKAIACEEKGGFVFSSAILPRVLVKTEKNRQNHHENLDGYPHHSISTPKNPQRGSW